MLRLILQVNSDAFEPAADYNFACVELTTPEVRGWIDYINEAHAFAKRNENFYAFELWDAAVNYCAAPPQDFDELFGPEWADRYDCEQYGIEPQSFSPPEYVVQRTECDRLKVHATEGMWWTATPKHSDEHLWTTTLSKDILHAILRRLRGNHLNTR